MFILQKKFNIEKRYANMIAHPCLGFLLYMNFFGISYTKKKRKNHNSNFPLFK